MNVNEYPLDTIYNKFGKYFQYKQIIFILKGFLAEKISWKEYISKNTFTNVTTATAIDVN